MTSKPDDEEALWRSVRDGDPLAFGAIFDLHRNRVFRQAQRMTLSIHDAEDITATTFLEAWRRRDAVRVVDGSVIGWLLVTANNLSRNLGRARHRYRDVLAQMREPDHLDDPTDRIGDRLDTDSRAATVRLALARLPKRDQDVIALCVVQEMSTTDAATVLGIPPGTVKSRLSRAKARLASDVLTSLTSTSLPTGGPR